MSTEASTDLHLGVNIDHVATLRQARGTDYPDPVAAALIAERAGADSITLHLREDRRHIQDRDLVALSEAKTTRINLEMAVAPEMLDIATRVRPADCCLVPEKREELTTEGGLDVAGQPTMIADACARLAAAGIRVSLFVDPEVRQLEAAVEAGAPVVEIHTGAYADADGHHRAAEFDRVALVSRLAAKMRKDYGGDVALVVRDTSPIGWDWDQAVDLIRDRINLSTCPFDRGIWLLSRSKDQLFEIFGDAENG